MMRIPMLVSLQLGETSIQTETELPFEPVDLPSMLPAFRLIADQLVDVAISNAASEHKTISCKKGCGACCRMAVPVSEPEAYRLRDVIDAMPEPRRSVIRQRFEEGMDVFRHNGLLENMFQRVSGEEEEQSAMARLDAYYATGVACPFLEEESCSIYDERPLICREFLVTSPAENCSNFDGSGVERLPTLARPGDALILIASNPNEKRVASMPMIQILEWTSEHPNPGQAHMAPEWMGLFAETLQTKANNML
jgi:Fe-S-cluster containining protein